ncbi:FAD-dependent oxidoreductase [Mariprofundus erugo]|uniref:FAD-dependent oxidoreductase n=1 Tax=Mariprofundus erugo TaxID=2528639 RepID=UPI0010FE2963|nr:FAD-dependent oxidoreductase [Mariprofundus erugo]TLS75090.1 FAD-dependent oxidoreductase [Mariprofundus erugo]
MEEQLIDGVIIYGGGIAGGILAKRLSRNIKVTLIDPLDYFEVPMAVPRAFVEPNMAKQSVMPFQAVMPEVEHLRARLVELNPQGGVVEASDGQQILIQSQLAVLATGSRFANELMRAPQGDAIERYAFYQKFHDRLTTAQRILIIGGGPIGIEVAGELTETWPEKSVTIIERGPRILGGTSHALADYAAAELKSRGVVILTGEQVEGAEAAVANVFADGGEVQTSSGQHLSYDLALWCIGGRPNTSYMYPHFSHVMTPERRIKVTPDLLVTGQSRLFAIGDITDLAENKMAFHIQGQVKVAEANIRAALAEKPMPRTYKPKTDDPTMVVTLGRSMGVSHLPLLGIVRSSWANRKIKAEHMLVPKFRKEMGQ